MPTKVHGPEWTAVIDDEGVESGSEAYDQEIDIRDINWEGAYQKLSELDGIGEDGWIEKYRWSQGVADKAGLWDIPAFCCVELAWRQGLLEAKPGDHGRVRPKYSERVQLDISDEFEASGRKNRIELRI